MSHYPKFADPARQDRPPVEQRPGEGPPMTDYAGDGESAGDDFAEEA
jgi:hypothetical protein